MLEEVGFSKQDEARNAIWSALQEITISTCTHNWKPKRKELIALGVRPATRPTFFITRWIAHTFLILGLQRLGATWGEYEHHFVIGGTDLEVWGWASKNILPYSTETCQKPVFVNLRFLSLKGAQGGRMITCFFEIVCKNETALHIRCPFITWLWASERFANKGS